MRTAGAFTLEIEPATGAMPPRVAIVLTNVGTDDRGTVRLTPACLTLDELRLIASSNLVDRSTGRSVGLPL